MAQHDHSIANDTGANVRADINNALSAIVSQNSGASAPTTTFALMWWFDTTNNLLKQRDESDANWVTLGSLVGTTWKPYHGGTETALFESADETKLDGIAAGAEVNPDVVPQAEAEAGTATTERIWTAERVKQAIDALSGTGDLVLLEAQTASASASLDMTVGIDSTYDFYRIVGVNLRPATDDVTMQLRVSDDGGSTFKSGASDYYWNKSGSTDGTTRTDANGSDAEVDLTWRPNLGAGFGVGNDTTHGISFDLILPNPASAAFHFSVLGQIFYRCANNQLAELSLHGRYVAAAAAINAFQILMGSGNVAEGSVYTYGVAKS